MEQQQSRATILSRYIHAKCGRIFLYRMYKFNRELGMKDQMKSAAENYLHVRQVCLSLRKEVRKSDW